MDVFVKSEPQLPPQFTDPKIVSLLSPDQQQQFDEDIRECKEALEDPKVQKKGEVRQRMRNLELSYQRQAPQAITGMDKDRLARLETRVRDKIREGMLTQEEMRKNPASAVDRHIKWERANKANILLYKKIRRVQATMDGGSPATWDREASNIEQFRPGGAVGRGYRGDAQIPGIMSYGDVPNDQWPFEAPSNTALEQAKRHKNISEETREQRRQFAANAREAKARKAAAVRAADQLADQVFQSSPGHTKSPVAVETESTSSQDGEHGVPLSI